MFLPKWKSIKKKQAPFVPAAYCFLCVYNNDLYRLIHPRKKVVISGYKRQNPIISHLFFGCTPQIKSDQTRPLTKHQGVVYGENKADLATVFTNLLLINN